MKADAVTNRVREIGSYYAACQHLFGNSVTISKAMLAYALDLDSIDQLEPLLLQFKIAGAVTSVADQMVSFASGFIRGEA